MKKMEINHHTKQFCAHFGVVMPSLLLSSIALAGGKSHKAHDHGVAQLSLVVEGQKVTAQFESPSESIYGFEHEAKTPKDIEKRDTEVAKFTSQVADLFQFDASAGCKLSPSKVEPFVVESKEEKEEKHSKKEAVHSEVKVTWEGQCTAAAAGSKMKVGFLGVFKKLKKLNVQVMSGEKQSGKMIKKNNEVIDL
jgi:hypothetical protein